MNETDPHLGKFERFEEEASQPSWLRPLRKAGIARFAELGFPTLQQEDWRFTNVAPIAKLPFRPVFQAARDGLTAETVAQFSFGQLPANRLVFADGHFISELSSVAPQPSGVIIKSLAAALVADSALVEKHLGTLGHLAGLTRLPRSTLHSSRTARSFIFPQERVVEAPIHLLFISTVRESGATAHPHNLVVAEKASRATILESYVSTANAACFTNAVTELVLEDGAAIEHCKFQDESLNTFHIAALHAHLGRGCNFISHSVATGARLSRNNIRATLAGEGVECVLNGLYLTQGDQLADHHMVVEHAQPRCNSHEYYNGILNGRSKGVFHGRILVRQAAQKTDAKQTNKNLLLSEDATVDTKPQLEIYADDVKCTHGATIGQLNEESIFYLRARGIGAQTARRMLIHAFAGEIIERVRHAPAREELDKLVWDRLEQNPHLA